MFLKSNVALLLSLFLVGWREGATKEVEVSAKATESSQGTKFHLSPPPST